MSKRSKSKFIPIPCPFCGRDIQIGVTDAEGNPKPDDYEFAPWSGIEFVIRHPEQEGVVCPIHTCGDEPMGSWTYHSRKDAINTWNTRAAVKA